MPPAIDVACSKITSGLQDATVEFHFSFTDLFTPLSISPFSLPCSRTWCAPWRTNQLCFVGVVLAQIWLQIAIVICNRLFPRHHTQKPNMEASFIIFFLSVCMCVCALFSNPWSPGCATELPLSWGSLSDLSAPPTFAHLLRLFAAEQHSLIDKNSMFLYHTYSCRCSCS